MTTSRDEGFPGGAGGARSLLLWAVGFATVSLAAASPSRLSLFATATGGEIDHFDGPALNAIPLAWAPDQQRVLVADAADHLVSFDTAGGHLARTLGWQTEATELPRLLAARWSADGREVLEVRSSLTKSQSALLVRAAATGRVRLTLHDPELGIADAFPTPEGRGILTLGTGTASLTWWDAATGRPLGRRLELWPGPLRCVTLATNAAPTTWWDANTGTNVPPPPASQPLHGGYGDRAVWLTGTGRLLAIGSGGWARLWDLEANRPLWNATVQTNRGLADALAQRVVFAPDGAQFLHLGFPAGGTLWDLQTRHAHPLRFQVVRTVQVVPYEAWPPPPPVTVRRPFPIRADDALFSPDGRTLLTWRRWAPAREVWLWALPSGRPVRPVRAEGLGPIKGMAFSPDGSKILALSEPR